MALTPDEYLRQLRALIRQNRAEIDRLVAQTEAALAANWQLGLAATPALYRPLVDHYARALATLREEAGDPAARLDLAWLTNQNRQLARIQASVDAALNKYAAQSLNTVGQAQSAAVGQGAAHASGLVQQSLFPAAEKGVDPGLLWNRPNPQALAQLVGYTGNGHPLGDLFQNWSREEASAARQVLMTGVLSGANPRAMAAGLAQALDIPRQRATIIARTEVMNAYRTAAILNYQANSDVLNGWLWSASGANPCACCMGMDGLIFTLGEFMEAHTCFPAGTRVYAAGIQRAYRRWYDGDLVEITTAAGYYLRGTPNHPVLTDRGWIGLGLLKEGDNVVSSGFREGVAVGEPDVDDVPSEVSELFDALTHKGCMKRVPIRDTDFHGDGNNGYVDIVSVHGELRKRIKPASAQHVNQSLLTNANQPRQVLPRHSAFARPSRPFADATSSRERVLGHTSPLLGRELGLSDTVGLGEATHGDAILNENLPDSALVDMQASKDGLLGFSIEVGLDHVVSINRVGFHGFVYNLQTKSETYLAVNSVTGPNAWHNTNSPNGVIVHNCCRCSPIPVTRPWADILGPWGIDTTDMEDFSLGEFGNYERGPVRFERMSSAQQRAIIGTNVGYQGYKKGLYSLEDFIGARPGTGGWGPSFYQRSVQDIELGRNVFDVDALVARREAQLAAEREAASAPFGPGTAFTVQQQQLSREALAELRAAQRQLNALRRAFEKARAANRFAPVPQDAEEALVRFARAQARVDLEAGGRGAIVLSMPYDNPFAGMERLAARTEQLFGRALSRDELASLVGAPEGSYVEIGETANRGLSIALHGPSYDPLSITSEARAEYAAERELVVQRGGNLVMENQTFSVRDDLRGQGLGARIFADQAESLSKLHVSRIETYAAGSGAEVQGANGYYVWPRLGYVGKLPEGALRDIQAAIERGELAPKFGKYSTIQQLMKSEEGRAWWKANGQSLSLKFDLKPNSLSMRTLHAYQDAKAAALPSDITKAGEQAAFAVSHAEVDLTTATASYDLTAADRVFVADLKRQIEALDQAALTHDDAIHLGARIHDRIQDSIAEFHDNALAAKLVLDTPYARLTPEQVAWLQDDPAQIAAHGGLKVYEAQAQYQAEFQARVLTYLQETRDLGGDYLRFNFNARGFDLDVSGDVARSRELVPTDWIQASNRMGDLVVVANREANSSGWYEQLLRGGGKIALDRNLAGLDRSSSALHELMHRMENAIPQIGQLEKAFYESRTLGDAVVELTNGIDAGTKLDAWADEYLGRLPITYRNGAESYELLSMGAEMLLGGGSTYDLLALRADEEYVNFVLGLLSTVRAQEIPAALESALESNITDINQLRRAEQAAFSAAKREVTYADNAVLDRISARVNLDRSLTDNEVANLAGAPPGSRISVSKYGDIQVTAPDSSITTVRVVPGDAEIGPVLLNWMRQDASETTVMLADPEMLATQIRQANKLDIAGIVTKVHHIGNDWVLLPEMGYDADIADILIEARSKVLPEGLEGVETLQQLLKTAAGRAWWRENGITPGLRFDVRPGSLSRRLFNRWLRSHGMRGIR